VSCLVPPSHPNIPSIVSVQCNYNEDPSSKGSSEAQRRRGAVALCASLRSHPLDHPLDPFQTLSSYHCHSRLSSLPPTVMVMCMPST
jgi:hypothetical protein